MSLKTCQTHGLSHFPLIEHQRCCVLSCMWRREGDGAGRNGCDLTGNTSRPIPAPGLSGPITGPQLAAACPLQRPRVQSVPITATESWLARDESPSLGEDSSPPEKDFVKSPNTSIDALSIWSVCTPFDVTFSRRPPSPFCCFLLFSVFYQTGSSWDR